MFLLDLRLVLRPEADERSVRFGLHSLGVAHDVRDRDRREHEPADPAQPDPVADPHVRELARDADRERVHCRRHRADGGAPDDHPRHHHAVVAEREHQRYQQRVEPQRLVRPAHRRAEQREQRHHGDDHEPRRVRAPRTRASRSRRRALRREHHRHERADREHEHEHADRAEEAAYAERHDDPGLRVLQPIEAVDRREEEVPDSLAEVLRRVDLSGTSLAPARLSRLCSYVPDGMRNAASQTRNVTMISTVIVLGNWKPFFSAALRSRPAALGHDDPFARSAYSSKNSVSASDGLLELVHEDALVRPVDVREARPSSPYRRIFRVF